MSAEFHDAARTAAEQAEARLMAERRDALLVQNDRLFAIIDGNHKVINANTEASSRLVGVMEQMQNTLTMLVTQVTTNINQRNDAVPLKVVLIMFGLMAIIILAVVGLDASNLLHFGSAP